MITGILFGFLQLSKLFLCPVIYIVTVISEGSAVMSACSEVCVDCGVFKYEVMENALLLQFQNLTYSVVRNLMLFS